MIFNLPLLPLRLSLLLSIPALLVCSIAGAPSAHASAILEAGQYEEADRPFNPLDLLEFEQSSSRPDLDLLKGEFLSERIDPFCERCPTYTEVEDFAKRYAGRGCIQEIQKEFYPLSDWYRLSAAGRFHQLQLALDDVLPRMKAAGARASQILAGSDRGYDPRLRPLLSCMMFHESAQPHPEQPDKLVGILPLAINYNFPACNPRLPKRFRSSANGLGQMTRTTFLDTFAEYTSPSWVSEMARAELGIAKNESLHLASSEDESYQEWTQRIFNPRSEPTPATSTPITSGNEVDLRQLFNGLLKNVELQISSSVATIAHKIESRNGSWFYGLRYYGPADILSYAPKILACGSCLMDKGIMKLYEKSRVGQKLTTEEELTLVGCLGLSAGKNIEPVDKQRAAAVFGFNVSEFDAKKIKKAKSSRSRAKGWKRSTSTKQTKAKRPGSSRSRR